MANKFIIVNIFSFSHYFLLSFFLPSFLPYFFFFPGVHYISLMNGFFQMVLLTLIVMPMRFESYYFVRRGHNCKVMTYLSKFVSKNSITAQYFYMQLQICINLYRLIHISWNRTLPLRVESQCIMTWYIIQFANFAIFQSCSTWISKTDHDCTS